MCSVHIFQKSVSSVFTPLFTTFSSYLRFAERIKGPPCGRNIANRERPPFTRNLQIIIFVYSPESTRPVLVHTELVEHAIVNASFEPQDPQPIFSLPNTKNPSSSWAFCLEAFLRFIFRAFLLSLFVCTPAERPVLCLSQPLISIGESLLISVQKERISLAKPHKTRRSALKNACSKLEEHTVLVKALNLAKNYLEQEASDFETVKQSLQQNHDESTQRTLRFSKENWKIARPLTSQLFTTIRSMSLRKFTACYFCGCQELQARFVPVTVC